MKTIQTKYLGPTNFKGSRIKAWDDVGNQILLGWRCEKNSDENHIEAVKALCNKLNIPIKEIITGSIKDSLVHIIKRKVEK